MKGRQIGKVYLVGAGPGDWGLMTIKGAEILSKAQTVVYDRLVSDDILLKAPAEAELINVGKESSRHSIPQSRINFILLEKAREGKTVVRLKGGDPFLFGRGGEELEALLAAGVPFEVVPGVTSALSAPAYAGIPVTHRRFSSAVHILTGHPKENGELEINYEALKNAGGTIIFLMGVATMKQLADGLLGAGMDGNTPAAAVENGTRSDQRVISSTLSLLAADARKAGLKSPAITVIGEVCSLAERLNWFVKSEVTV